MITSIRRTTTLLTMSAALIAGSPVGGDDSASGGQGPWGPKRAANRDYQEADDLASLLPTFLLARADGTQVMVFEMRYGHEGRIELSTRPPGGKWSDPTVIATIPAACCIGLSSAVLSDDGELTVSYAEQIEDGRRSMVVTVDESGEVGEPTELERGESSGWINLFGNGRGDVLAVDFSREEITFTKPRDGQWSDAVPFVGVITTGLADFTVGPDGRAMGAWVQSLDAQTDSSPGRVGTVAWSELTEDGWSDPQQLPMRTGDLSYLNIAENPSGDVAVVWTRKQVGADRVQVVRRPVGAPWQKVETVNSPRRDHATTISHSHIVMAADGTATVVWSRVREGLEVFNNRAVRGTSQFPGGAWERSTRILDRRCYVYTTRLATNRRGDVLLSCLWDTTASAMRPGKSLVYSARYVATVRPSGGEWERQYHLTRDETRREGVWLSETRAVVTERGEAMVSFTETETNAIWTRARDVAEAGRGSNAPITDVR